eukprot:CAMPEP_0172734992 /NCGR_PEP_ID=MMETSP1074-20121228/111338_1 /TAXON_ID=2916 /ORGANISM="Ceratium fusus, Strain PA161109" /LENGTH=44 /DNA_ID= /DNA_START= /DNA_END= /DNA_ORIENTATION=
MTVPCLYNLQEQRAAATASAILRQPLLPDMSVAFFVPHLLLLLK